MNSFFSNLLDVTKNVGAEIIDNITPNDYNLRDLEKKYTIKDISDDEEWVFLCLEVNCGNFIDFFKFFNRIFSN